jgi:1-acyl-sn-glycerol-3-phosphate acyltransferase
VIVEILDPIPPGLTREAFSARLQHDIETATARLVAEGMRAAQGSGESPLGMPAGE